MENINIVQIGQAIVGLVKILTMGAAIMTMVVVGTTAVRVADAMELAVLRGIILHHNQLGRKHDTKRNYKKPAPHGGSGSYRWKFKKDSMPFLPGEPRNKSIVK
jgi:hypothetical protein